MRLELNADTLRFLREQRVGEVPDYPELLIEKDPASRSRFDRYPDKGATLEHWDATNTDALTLQSEGQRYMCSLKGDRLIFEVCGPVGEGIQFRTRDMTPEQADMFVAECSLAVGAIAEEEKERYLELLVRAKLAAEELRTASK